MIYFSRTVQMDECDYLQSSHSQPSRSCISPVRVTKLAQCESLLRKYDVCMQIGKWSFLY